MGDFTSLKHNRKTSPDMKLRSGKNICRTIPSNETEEVHARESNEGGCSQQSENTTEAATWKDLVLNILIIPLLAMLQELRWPSQESFHMLTNFFFHQAQYAAEYMANRRIILALISLWTKISNRLYALMQIHYLQNNIPMLFRLLCIILITSLVIISSIAYSFYQPLSLVPQPTAAIHHNNKAESNKRQYMSFPKQLLDIDSKVTEQGLRLEQLYQYSQYNSKILLEKMSFISTQIKEQQSQLNYQREDYRRIWDALYTQNQYMLSVSDDIKLDVIEALQDNTVAVFDKKTQELKVSPEFLQHMQSANFIQAFIEHNKKTIKSFVQEELCHFFLTQKDDMNNIKENINRVPSTLENIVKTAVEKYHYQLEDEEPDFALHSRGGSIILSKTSKTYRPPTTSRMLLLRALGYYSRVKSPRTVVQPSIQVGECWSMEGSNGTIGISLSTEIFMESVTLEHPSAKTLLHEIVNAPRCFKVFGISADMPDLQEELFFLGQFEYDIHSEQKAQKFMLANKTDRPFYAAIIQIMSNWGNPNFTDIYRIKISGKPAPLYDQYEPL